MKKQAKLIASAVIMTVLAASFVFPSAAFVAAKQDVAMTIDGRNYLGDTILYKDTTYVGFRRFCHAYGLSRIDWNEKTATASVTSYYLVMSASDGANYIIANGRYFWCEHGIFTKDGTMYVPLRAIAKAFGASVGWDEDAFAASVTSSYSYAEPASSYYDIWEVYWLSHIIHAEAGCEPLLGKMAVGNVVLNRVASPKYPDTVYGVIFDMRCGPQFTPAATGSVYADPDPESIIAAKLCLEGYTLSESIEFFMNPAIADTEWMVNNCEYCFTIAHHDFYRS